MNWKEEIHPSFTLELQKEWEDRGFNCEIVKKLTQIWGESFDSNDYGFFNWVKGSVSDNDWLKESRKNEEKLRIDYQKHLEREVEELQKKLKELEVKLIEWGENWEEIKREYLKAEKKVRQIHLDKLKNIVENKINKKQWYMLETLLRTQEEVVKNNGNNFAQRQLEEFKKELGKKADIQELEELCKAQIKVSDVDNMELSPLDVIQKMPQLSENYLSLIGKYESSKKTLFSLSFFKSKVKNREIIDINYELEKASKEEISPDVIFQKQVSNPLNSDTKQIEKYTYKKSKVRTWNNSIGVEMGAIISLKAGIPVFAEGKIALSPKVNYFHQQGSSENEENTIESSCEVNIPANSKGEIIIVAKKIKITVPFKYTELMAYTGGEVEKVLSSGTYESVESYDINVELKTEKLGTQIQQPPKS